MVRMAVNLAECLGIEIATPKEARQILGISNLNK